MLEKLRSTGYSVIDQPNLGTARARMAGVRTAREPYIFSLDADDALIPGSLCLLSNALDEEDDLAAVWGDFVIFGDTSHYKVTADTLDPWEITFTNDVPVMALIRRAVLVETGGWQLDDGWEDWDLWMTLAERGYHGRRIPVPVARYRKHGRRQWQKHMDRHTELTRQLRQRHPRLFQDRPRHAKLSRVPLPVRVAATLIEATPGLSTTRKGQLVSMTVHGARRFRTGAVR